MVTTEMPGVHLYAKANYFQGDTLMVLCSEGQRYEVMGRDHTGMHVRTGRLKKDTIFVQHADIERCFDVIPGDYTSLLGENAVFTLAAEKCADFFVRRTLVSTSSSELAPLLRQALVRRYLDLFGYDELCGWREFVFASYPQVWLHDVFAEYGLTYKQMMIEGDKLELELCADGCVLVETTHYHI